MRALAQPDLAGEVVTRVQEPEHVPEHRDRFQRDRGVETRGSEAGLLRRQRKRGARMVRAEVRRVVVELRDETGPALEQPDEHRDDERAQDVDREREHLQAQEQVKAALDEQARGDQDRDRAGDEQRVVVREPVTERQPAARASEASHHPAERAEPVGRHVRRVKAVDESQPHAEAEIGGEADRRMERAAVEHVVATRPRHDLREHRVHECARETEQAAAMKNDTIMFEPRYETPYSSHANANERATLAHITL